MHFRREGPAEPRLGPHQIWPKTPLRESLRSLSASGSLYTSPWCTQPKLKRIKNCSRPRFNRAHAMGVRNAG
jgi:hypothetical protein